MISWCSRATSMISSSTLSGYSAPVGLFGLMTTMPLRARRDLALDVGDVGHPVGLLVADVVHRRAAGQAHHRGPQRVVGRRDQHFVAVVEQRVHAHRDQLGRTVAQVHVVDRRPRRRASAACSARPPCAARTGPCCRCSRRPRARQVADHVLHDLVGRLEAERGHVADVQLDDLVALFLHLAGLVQHRAHGCRRRRWPACRT